MRIIFLGPPGCGKGTQARLISHQYNIANISTGVMLRQEFCQYSLGHIEHKKKTNIINSGDLIDDEVIIQLIVKRVQQDDCRHGFILDGFPRTMIQALSMDEYQISIDVVIQFVLSDSIIINRIAKRRIHLPSGRTYHTIFHPPKRHNIDDVTGEMLTIREDDHENAIRLRLIKYYQHIAPLINFYKEKFRKKNIRFVSIDGNQEIYTIHEKLKSMLYA